MATKIRQLGFLTTALFLLAGCTSSLPIPDQQQTVFPQAATGTSLVSVASVQFQSQNTNAMQMVQSGGSLYLTGTPFGFAQWDITADPENPTLTFAAADQLTSFAPPPFDSWVVSYWASNALAILPTSPYGYPFAFTSGSAGMDAVSLHSISNPTIVMQLPVQDPSSITPVGSPSFEYRALAAHPSLPIVYGFGQQDAIYALSLTNNTVNVIAKYPYSSTGAPVCCVRGAAMLGTRLFVAFSSQLVYFDMQPDGSLKPPGQINTLQAMEVAVSNNLLFVVHQPTPGQPQGLINPAGIYVLNGSLQNLDTILYSVPIYSMAADPLGNHLYLNQDGSSVKIFRIQWKTGAPPQ